MKKQLRILKPALLLLAFLSILFGPFPALAANASDTKVTPADADITGWIKDNSGIRYYNSSYVPITGRRKIDGSWYYFDKSGYLRTGWINYNGNWIYFDKTGVQQKKTWVKWENNYYYINSDGYMTTGWKTISGKKYYFHPDGIMASSEYVACRWLKKNGILSNTAASRVVWVEDSKGEYLQATKGKWYAKNEWLWIDGYCYYFNNKGYLVKNKTIKGSTVNKQGKYVQNGKVVRKKGTAKASSRILTKKGVKTLAQLLPPTPDWSKIKVIRHACGVAGDLTYTNSKEALADSIADGVKAIEIDFRYTSDQKLVCAHVWGNLEMTDAPTLKEFLKYKFDGKYTTMTAETALKMLIEAGDVYLVVDTKERNVLPVYQEIDRILSNLKGGNYYKRMVVPQIYYKDQYKPIMGVYPYKNQIFSIYKITPRDDSTFKDIADFCAKNKIGTFTLPKKDITTERFKYISGKKLRIGVHTINEEDEWKQVTKAGAGAIYTDFLN